MHTGKKELWTILFFAVIFPVIIFSFKTDDNTSPAKTLETTQTAVSVTLPSQECMIRLLETDGTITVMTLETYISGVVLKEMPADFAQEANEIS